MNVAKVSAECYFVDVGQGTCNVILLGQRRAIVIDCGRSAFVPLKLLKRYADRIVALVVSHNDIDHHGGAAAILAAYPKAVETLYFLQDRPIERLSLYATVRRELELGNLLNSPVRLERDSSPRIIYRDQVANLSLELLFPTLLDNLQAQAVGSANATSAVVVLFCGSRRIIYPGDATLDEWRRVNVRTGAIPGDLVAVSHHGGNLSKQARTETAQQYEARIRRELDWLYTQAMQCDHAVVSVGTNNNYGHPTQATIHGLRAANMLVMCTQITPRCHEDLESLRPGVIQPMLPARSRPTRDLSPRGYSRNVACAGTVLTEIGPTHVAIQRLRNHQDAIDRLCESPDGHPLCRPRASPVQLPSAG